MKDNPDLHKLTTKGQITLPKKLRGKLKIKPGDFLSIFQVGENIVLTKKAPSQSPRFRGRTLDKQNFLDENSFKEKQLTASLNKLYDQAILLEERDRVLLIKFLLDSLVKTREQPSDLKSLKGIGKGLWRTKEDIEKQIEDERSSWEK